MEEAGIIMMMVTMKILMMIVHPKSEFSNSQVTANLFVFSSKFLTENAKSMKSALSVCTALPKWLSYFTIIMAEKQFTPTFSLFVCMMMMMMMMMMEGSGKKEKGRHRAVTESGAKS